MHEKVVIDLDFLDYVFSLTVVMEWQLQVWNSSPCTSFRISGKDVNYKRVALLHRGIA